MSKQTELYEFYSELEKNHYDMYVSNTPKLVHLEKVKFNPATGKYDDIDWENLATYKKKITDWVAEGKATQTGMKNLLLDPFGLDYTEVDGKKIPNTGFKPEYGIMKIECVSPLWRGAQAVDGTPEGSVDDYKLATPDKPLSGTYGRVFGRGGFGSTWGGNRSNGHIFKLTAPKVDNKTTTTWLTLSNADLKEFAQVGIERLTCRFRAWVYVEKGVLSFGSHAGYQGNLSGKHIVDTLNEWTFVDIEFSYVTGNPFYRGFNIGSNTYNSELEAYMVAPLLTVATGNTSYMA